MLGGRVNAGGGSPGSLSYARHAMAGQTSQAVGVAYSPQSLYTPTQPSDTYSAASIHMDPFPATPYTPVSSLFHSPTIRAGISSQYAAPKRSVMTVTSSMFSTFTTIFKLEETAKPSAVLPHVKIQVFQTGSRLTDKEILLRRVTNQTTNRSKECAMVLEKYRYYRHPNLVSLIKIYPTSEFVMGENDIIMEYRYVVGAKSLYEAFITGGRATEGLLWSFTCQMVSLLRSFHETSLPLRGLHWSKIVFLETTGRFYYTGLGMVELLDAQPNVPISTMMQQDIESLGVVLMQLATQSVEFRLESFKYNQPISGFSNSFWELVKTCLESKVNSAQLCHALGERMSMEVGHHEGHADYMLSQCGKELHNGRLMRLMMKLNFVLEGPSEMDILPDNRYTLRLFNQFLFNQVDEQNRLHLDWGHAYHCLNKLDCGSQEMIQLISADQQEVVVISYADLRSILEACFERLQQLSRPAGDELGYIASPSVEVWNSALVSAAASLSVCVRCAVMKELRGRNDNNKNRIQGDEEWNS
eukprot:gene13346-9178_t